MNFLLQDNEEDDPCVEAEEVFGKDGVLISNLNDLPQGDKITTSENVLLPDLQPGLNRAEPNYDEMDNLTLLSSLCLHSDLPSVPLLSELD